MTDSRNAGSAPIRLLEVRPTLFFARSGDGLQQAVDLVLANEGPAVEVEVLVHCGGRALRLPLAQVEPGKAARRIYVPEIREPTPVEVTLLASGEAQDRRSLAWTPQRQWEVYLTHLSHHDLGYTDLPSNLLREHDGFVDEILRFCEETAAWPEDSRFRYTVEQSWSILHYLANRPPHTVERAVHYLREGRIEVTALLGNETSELCGHEEQIRLIYPSHRLRRRYGIPIRTAHLTDVPGLSWGLASVLAGCGVRYLVAGIPDYYGWGRKVRPLWDEAAVIPRAGAGAFWWQGPGGQRVLLWYGPGLTFWNCEQAEAHLGEHLAGLAQRGYPHDLVRFGFWGGFRDNAPPAMRLSLIAREWNSRWAYPRLVVGTDAMFFERYERVAGGGLPVLRGDLPNTDYTIGAGSTARETGINRLAHDTLTSAEKMAACATLISDYHYPAETLAEAYDSALLYDEHTWGMHHPIGPAQEACWSQKAQFAYRGAALAHDVLTKSANRIADQVGLDREGFHILVFNPLGEERTDVVRVPGVEPSPCGLVMHWRHPQEGEQEPPVWAAGTAIGRNVQQLPLSLLQQPFELVEVESGHPVPYQIVTVEDPLAARPLASQRVALGAQDWYEGESLSMNPVHRMELVFVAEGMPALGYRTYRLVPAPQWPTFGSSLQLGENTLENRFYHVTLDPVSGAVASIHDKELGRELIDGAAPYGLNQLIARSAGAGAVTAAARSAIAVGERGPVCASLVVSGDGPGCPRRTQEVTLYDSLKRIDLATRLLRDGTPHLELLLAFPFAVGAPRFAYEASNAVVEPIRDQLPGSNTDAYTVQHWVTVEDGETSIAWCSLEAPVIALGELWPSPVSQAHHGITPPGYGHEFLRDPRQLAKGHIFSYAMASNFRTNFSPVQPGDALFRHTLSSSRAPGRDSARRLGWGATTPLVPVCLTGARQGSLPPAAGFCRVDAPNVLLLTVKAAEDGDGLILRLAEVAGQETTVTVSLPWLEISQAVGTHLAEEDERMLCHDRHSVRVAIGAHGIATVRCRTARRWPAVDSLARW